MRGRGRGRGRVAQRPPRTPKVQSEALPWTESEQSDVLNKFLQVLRTPLNISSSKDTVEFYAISDLIPFVISRIGALSVKPATRDQLHGAIKKALLENPASAKVPPVDVIYLFSKLLADGLISISIKQEVSFYNPPCPQYTNPRTILVVDRPKAAPYEVDQDLTWQVHQAWNHKQLSWRKIQQAYLSNNEDKIDKSPKYQNMQSHYQRVCKWIENITQKQLDQYKKYMEEENNNGSTTDVVGVEFHTHSNPWTFLNTLMKLFRVARKIDDKLVDELIKSLEENGRLKIENNQVTYLNKPAATGASIPPIAPAVTSIFASTPSKFYQHNRVEIDGSISHLLPILAKTGNPETTFYVFSKEEQNAPQPTQAKTEVPKEAPKPVEQKPTPSTKQAQPPKTQPQKPSQPQQQPKQAPKKSTQPPQKKK